MTEPLASLPTRPLTVADYEAINDSGAPLTAFPVSWYDEKLIYSMVLFVRKDPEPRPVIVAYDEADGWEVVDRPDPDRGFDEIDELLRPWFEETYGTIPDELAIAPPDYDLYDDSR